MEKPQRSKSTIMLKYLQKAATFTITANHHSPRSTAVATAATDRLATTRNLHAPITSIIPTEARHNKRNFNEEPNSPKVSCIGQIKYKKTTTLVTNKKKNKQISSAFTRILSQKIRPDHSEKKEEKMKGIEEIDGAGTVSSLGGLRKFASGRATLGDFDWEEAVAVSMEGGEEERNVYHSAPLVSGGGVGAIGATHREVGLWRRRSLAALVPLKVNN